MGTADFACPSLASLDDARGIEVAGVVTQPDRPKGRQLIPNPSPVKLEAESRHLPVHQPERLRSDIQYLEQLAPDLIVVAAYGQILPQVVLDLPPHGCLNVHGSLLPAYRGAAPIQHAILDGQAETGITIMQMDAGLDTGAMLSKAATPIEPTDNAQTLHDRLAKLGAELLLETIPRHVAGEITPEPQDETLATHAAKITPRDGPHRLVATGDTTMEPGAGLHTLARRVHPPRRQAAQAARGRASGHRLPRAGRCWPSGRRRHRRRLRRRGAPHHATAKRGSQAPDRRRVPRRHPAAGWHATGLKKSRLAKRGF